MAEPECWSNVHDIERHILPPVALPIEVELEVGDHGQLGVAGGILGESVHENRAGLHATQNPGERIASPLITFTMARRAYSIAADHLHYGVVARAPAVLQEVAAQELVCVRSHTR